MQAIKTVLIGVTGSSFRTGKIDHHLTSQGLIEMRHALEQLTAENRKPKVIYCSTDPAHIASAYMLAAHPSVDHVIPSKTLCFGRDDWFKEKRRLQDKLREAFKTTYGAIEYLRRMASVRGNFEEVMVLTGQCWGNSFGYAGTWHRGALYSFDLNTQNIQVVGVHSVGI